MSQRLVEQACASWRRVEGGPISYSPNALFGACSTGGDQHCGAFGYAENGNGGYWDKIVKISTFTKPSETIAVAEKHNDETGNLVRFSAPLIQDWEASLYKLSWLEGSGLAGTTNRIPIPFHASWAQSKRGDVAVRHLETSNFLFADGHVKAMRPERTHPVSWGHATNMWDRLR